MTKQSSQQKLAKLLKQAAEAHHQAFKATNGKDENWPNWYAKFLLENNLEHIFSKKSKGNIHE